MLRAVQYVEVGGERRRLTFRALDVEQIGYVYEGLLELEVRTAEDVVLHFVRSSRWPRGSEPSEVPLGEARGWLGEGVLRLAERLVKRTDRAVARLQRDLRREIEADERLELLRAVGGDAQLGDVVVEFLPVLHHREQRPAVTLRGRRYVAPSTRRAATGTHYTPRWLAEEVAEGALEALVYRPGPLETADRAQWQLRPSSELLDLRVADIAMGSGAFLVAACRYLADRLLEAWEAEGREEALRVVLARRGATLASDAEVADVLLDARRLVAEHCLYGVDVNPLAVEMAKLSLWLVTMDDERPFGFLDDRFLCGDSLLGLASFAQLEALHPDPRAGRSGQLRVDVTGDWRTTLGLAADLRRRITAAPVVTVRDVEHKQRLLAQAGELTGRLRVVADAVTGRGMVSAGLKGEKLEDAFWHLGVRVGGGPLETAAERLAADVALLQAGRPEGVEPRRPFHWPLAFPEVLVDTIDPGFDAIIGNPRSSAGRRCPAGLARTTSRGCSAGMAVAGRAARTWPPASSCAPSASSARAASSVTSRRTRWSRGTRTRSGWLRRWSAACTSAAAGRATRGPAPARTWRSWRCGRAAHRSPRTPPAGWTARRSHRSAPTWNRSAAFPVAPSHSPRTKTLPSSALTSWGSVSYCRASGPTSCSAGTGATPTRSSPTRWGRISTSALTPPPAAGSSTSATGLWNVLSNTQISLPSFASL